VSAGADRLPRIAGLPWLMVALRYLGAVRRTRGVSLVSMVSVAGLVLGVAALITVLSVMNGFDAELRGRILGIVPHLLLEPPGPADTTSVEAVARELRGRPGVRGVARHAEVRGMVTTGSRVLPIALVGIEPEREPSLSPLAGALVLGELAELTPDDGVLIGAPLAARLGLFPGDRVSFLLPRARADSVQPLLVSSEVRGLFRFGAEPDHLLAFVHVDALTARQGLADVSLRLAAEDVFAAPRMATAIAAEPRFQGWRVRDWTDRYGELFAAVGMEKTMMGLLLGLIVAIAVFNIVASLAMLVDEKRGAIAILRTLGASRGDVVRVFLLQGAVVGALGAMLGTLLGIVLALEIGDLMHWLEELFGFRLLAGTYFDRLPSVLLPSDIALIAPGAFTLAVAGACYPALRAGRLDPAPALHGL
jgi:lipoprotein-releasing system permease protein